MSLFSNLFKNINLQHPATRPPDKGDRINADIRNQLPATAFSAHSRFPHIRKLARKVGGK